MKKFFTTAVLVLLAFSGFCQEEEGDDFKTIFGDKDSNGGYGSFSIGYSIIADKDAATFGGRGAWIINHGLALGFGGEGFVSEENYDFTLARQTNLVGGYGGMLIEPIILPKFPVHISVPVLFGAGGIAYTTIDSYEHEYDERDNFVEDSKGFFFVKPGVEMELNLTRYFRMAFGGYYMYTSKLDLMRTPNDALNGISAAITFKFGKF